MELNQEMKKLLQEKDKLNEKINEIRRKTITRNNLIDREERFNKFKVITNEELVSLFALLKIYPISIESKATKDRQWIQVSIEEAFPTFRVEDGRNIVDTSYNEFTIDLEGKNIEISSPYVSLTETDVQLTEAWVLTYIGNMSITEFKDIINSKEDNNGR